jgi:hypothetical protein
VHPTKRKNLSPRGYRVTQFADAFARFLPAVPHIRTSRKKQKRAHQQTKSRTPKRAQMKK